nr:unnamed protein product [Spirometra erinaceieuropaei]
MVDPTVSTRDRLCHQNVPLVSPPDEDIVQQVPLTRPRMPPGGLLSLSQAEEGVRRDESVFCADSKKGRAIFIGAVEAMGTQHSSPGSMVCADAGAEVTKDNHFLCLRHSRQEGMQVLEELVSCCVNAVDRWSVGADDGGEFASPKRQTIVDALRQTGQSSHDALPDGKGDARFPSLRL